MLIVPPLYSGGPYNGTKPIININCPSWGMWGGGGPYGSYFNPPPSATVLVFAPVVLNGFTGTNGIGPSFIDCRAFNNASGFSYNNLYGRINNIPGNAVQVRFNGFINDSFDSGAIALNFSGAADGSGGGYDSARGGFNIIGGSLDSYYEAMDEVASNKNSIGYIGPANNQGQFGQIYYPEIAGQYIGLECGNNQVEDATIGNCSNAVDFSYTPAYNVVLDNLQIGGGVVNILATQPYSLGNGGPQDLIVTLTTLDTDNGLPNAQHEHIINDQYWTKTGFDGFYAGGSGAGDITIYTNGNAGGNLLPDFIWSASDFKVRELTGDGVDGQAQESVLYGDVNFYHNVNINTETATNLTIAANGYILNNGKYYSTEQGDAYLLQNATGARINFNSTAECLGYGLSTFGTYSYPNLEPIYLGYSTSGGIGMGPAVNNDGTWVAPTNAFFNCPMISMTNVIWPPAGIPPYTGTYTNWMNNVNSNGLEGRLCTNNGAGTLTWHPY
jgi:hypothetical protein